MDRHLVITVLAGLLCVLAALAIAWLARRSRQRTCERQQREQRQAERETLAATRIARNGGQALSSRFAAVNAPHQLPERST
jgi:membrane protein implicated in regulation of membrane protease activity